jgi:dihydroorotase
MPNTEPAIDSHILVEFIQARAERARKCRVYVIGALTKGRQGKELAEIGRMAAAGAVAFSDDGEGVADAGVCLKAMNYVAQFDRLFIQHCEDLSLSAGGVMNSGSAATRLGLAGISTLSEDAMVARDLLLASQSRVRYHVAHISSARSVEMVREARKRGVAVTTEVCPHHLLLTDEACSTYDTNFKMNPPLRSEHDIAALIEAVRDGTIDCLVTDHAPHTREKKELPFAQAPMGITGLETALPLFVRALIEPGHLDWISLIRAMSTRPAKLLRVAGGSLRAGEPADVTLIDPAEVWEIDPVRMHSKCQNTPFGGWKVRGRAAAVWVGGEQRYAVGN